MDLVDKEKTIRELLSEMSNEKVKENEFTDLLIQGYIENEYNEEVKRWASVKGFKTIITENVDKTSIIVFDKRLNNICLEKTFVKNGMLKIVYDEFKEMFVGIEYINKIFIMKKGDNYVY